jgi:hypothetical protein
MKVSELIKRLQNLPQDFECVIDQDGVSFAEVLEVAIIRECYVPKYADVKSVVIGEQ